MMSFLQSLPTRDPASFTRCSGASCSAEAPASPRAYVATHDRTEAPQNQVIVNESTSILIREFEKLGDKLLFKAERGEKRKGDPEDSRHRKNPRRNCSYNGNYRAMLEVPMQLG